MHLADGKVFKILAPGVNAENIYIQSVKLNGQPYDKSYITHDQIMSGATLEFEMGNQLGIRFGIRIIELTADKRHLSTVQMV